MPNTNPDPIRARRAAARRRTKATRLYQHSRLTGTSCRVEWDGPFTEGQEPLVPLPMGRKREARRMAYEIHYGLTRPTDRIVALCDNPRCLNGKNHLRVIPALSPTKAGSGGS